MRTAQNIIDDMGELTDTDRECISEGFDAGNYRAAYETETYDHNDPCLCGTNGFYRVGYMLGFFSSYEIHEIPEEYQKTVEIHREACEKLGFGF